MTTPGTRFDWTATARGTRTVPVLLIAGMPAVFVPEGSAIASVSLAVAADSAWWPGASADLSAYVKPWLSLPHGLAWSEKIVPADPQALDVGAVEVMLSDPAGAATALFAARDSTLSTDLSAEATATDTTVHVVSTTGFDASGVLHLGREAIAYSGVTSTTFTGCTRGRFGSAACRHPFAGAAGGVGIEAPTVCAAPFDVVGRPASLWMATVSASGVITAAELEFFGHVGVDAALSDEGDGWLLRIDHAVHKLQQAPRSPQVTVGGWAHTGNAGVRADARPLTATATGRVAKCPLYLYVGDEIAGAPTYSLCLSDEASFPDSGGWHPSRESFVNAMNAAAVLSLSGSDQATFALNAGGGLDVTLRLATSGPHFATLFAPWANLVATSILTSGASGSAVYSRWTAPDMPLAWVPIDQGSRVYLSPVDYATVPTLPTNPAAGVDAHTELYYVLALGPDSAPRYARITDRASSGGVQYLVASALQTNDLPHPPTGTPDAVEVGAAFTVREPTPARLVLMVRSAHWVDAVHALLVSLDAENGEQLAEAIDWDDMRAQVSAGGAIPLTRSFILDAKQTPLEWLVNECALAGFALVLRGGRISMARVAEFSPTEAADTIQSADLVRGEATPGYARGPAGIINRMTFKWPVGDRSLNVIDTTSVDRYGASRTAITATIPANVLPARATGDTLFAALWTLGMTAVGPHRRPAETITVTLSLKSFDLAVGDVVNVTLWRVPDDQGGRGVTSVVGQVIARDPSLYAEGRAGTVRYTIRLSPKGLTGWAPSILVGAGGIVDDVVTADDTTFAASGFAPPGHSPTYGFALGDKVRMVEIDNTSPTTATRHTITAVTATTITLSPAPNWTFTSLCASVLKAIVIPDDYDTTGLQAGQKRYAYLAPRATLLLATGARAQRIAA